MRIFFNRERREESQEPDRPRGASPFATEPIIDSPGTQTQPRLREPDPIPGFDPGENETRRLEPDLPKAATKRVLIVSLYYPPKAGPGSIRILKFTKYLRESGWEPVVLTPRTVGAWPHDSSLVPQIPSGLVVERSFCPEPHALYCWMTGRRGRPLAPAMLSSQPSSFLDRLLRRIRLNLVLPDGRVGWMPFCFLSALRLLQENSFDCILTSSPPHSIQLTGWLLRRWTGLPWVADLRDPWTEAEYYRGVRRSRTTAKIDGWLERLCFQNADHLITTSRGFARRLADRGNLNLGEKLTVISNGVDPVDLPHRAPQESSRRFRVTHVGSLPASRNPETLFFALRDAIREDPRIEAHLELRFVGPIAPKVRETLGGCGLLPRTLFSTTMPYLDGLQVLAQSDLLLVPFPEGDAKSTVLPAKLFDSMAARKPILACGHLGGEGSEILNEWCGQGVVPFGDVDEARKRILTAFRNYLEKTPQAPPPIRECYHRSHLTRRLAAVLDEVTNSKATPS